MFAYQFNGEGEKFGEFTEIFQAAEAACDAPPFLYAHTLEWSAAGRLSVSSPSILCCDIDIALQLDALADSAWGPEKLASYLRCASMVPLAEAILKPAYRVKAMTIGFSRM